MTDSTDIVTPTPALIRATGNYHPKYEPYLPGHSGNPGGRPKAAFSLAALIKVEASKRPEMAKVLVDAACEGDLRAFELVLAYTDGKPTQRIEIDTEAKEAGAQLQALFLVKLAERMGLVLTLPDEEPEYVEPAAPLLAPAPAIDTRAPTRTRGRPAGSRTRTAPKAT